ncbi:axonemal protein [Caerostris extrusa]|uniref:Axonemal protein n=1 Tax=Caerostris extrusa TaxID=172846 RepID=A0AAV4MVG1_CAEEX|nr:axonemal protein [Caerostris extrusa]
MQSIKNLQYMMRKKMDKATFRILRAANKHINDESFNMEFGVTNQSNGSTSFYILSMGIWHSMFDNVTPTFCESAVPNQWKLGELVSKDNYIEELLEQIYPADVPFGLQEEKELVRILILTSIIPIRHPKPDMSPAVAAEFADSEIKRFDREILPDNVLFLEQPIPAFWIPLKKGFTTIGFFETKYDEGSQQNSALLIITGMQVAIKIHISKKGCCIQKIERDGKPLFPDSYSTWMSPDELIKNAELENWTYSCMSILCHTFNFYWSRWNATVSSDQLVMKYNYGEDKEDIDVPAPQPLLGKELLEKFFASRPEVANLFGKNAII